MSGRYLEDFAAGQTFGSGQLRIEKERAKSLSGIMSFSCKAFVA